MFKFAGTGFKTKKSMAFAVLLVPALLFLGSIVFSAKPDLYGRAEFSWSILDSRGRLMWLSLSEDDKYRCFVPLEQIPDTCIQAAILYEDRDFYNHWGVNFLSLGRAVYSMALGGRRVGASTLTMQLVRLAEREQTDTVPKKLWQMWRAFVYEYHYTKREILEAYLNLAPYGANVEGIGAAALVWFHKNVQDLNLAESIALTAVPQNPGARSPLIVPNPVWDKARQRLFALWNTENPSPYNAMFAKLPLRVFSPKDLPFHCPHAVLEIYEKRPCVLQKIGKKPGVQEIRTSLDIELQHELERVLSRYVADKKAYGVHNGAMVLADWQNGKILALVGSADFFDTGISGQIDGTDIPRSYGSTLKPFIYALALDQGLIHSKTVLLDTKKSFAGYEPENADGLFRGPVYADSALKNSRNIPAIYLAEKLHSPDLYGFLQKAGIRLPQSREHYGLALVLGGAEIRLRGLASLYAMLANRGFMRQLSYYADEHGAKGENAEQVPLLSPEASYITLKMLETKSVYPFSSVLASWKTGTSNGQRDALTAGIFGPYVLAVWIGNFDASPNPNFIGSKAALPLFFQAAERIQQRNGGLDRPWYTDTDLNVREVEVCASTGDVNLSLCPQLPKAKAYFIPGTSPIKETGVLRRILVNKDTGLRECRQIPGVTEERVYEFWSQDLQRLFADAGIYKTPVPPYSLQCLQDLPPQQGMAPQIVSPVKGVLYQQDAKNSQQIYLAADADADVMLVHWFMDSAYIGCTEKNESLAVTPKAGAHTVYAVDEFGRASSLVFKVEKAG